MIEYVIIDPYACSIIRRQFVDLAEAMEFAGLDNVTIQHVWGPFAERAGCAIVLAEPPPEQYKYFAIKRKLYAGRAILFGFDHHGKRVNVPSRCDYVDLDPIWLDNEQEVERAISSRLVDRPSIKNNSVKWPLET